MAEAATSEAASGVLTPPGYERLTKKSETRTLRLAAGGPIELILGKGHIIRLRRENDGVVRLSIDGFQLEAELPPNASVDIRMDSGLADNQVDIKKVENYDEFLRRQIADYRIDFPNRAVNLRGQNIDFTDIEDGLFSVLSIMIGVAGRRAGDNMIFITNHDDRFGVAVPAQQFDQRRGGSP